MNREELLNQLEEIQTEYKRRMHDAQAKEDYIFASGLCGATARIIKIVKDDKEQNERLQKDLAELKKKYEKVCQENRHLEKEIERLKS